MKNIQYMGLLLFTCLYASWSQAQTPIWGVGSGVGAAAAEFRDSFVQAVTFVAGDHPTSWTALSIFDSDGLNVPGAAYWTRDTTGRSRGGYFGSIQPFEAPTRANGHALFDSDYLDCGGQRGVFGTGSAPSPHRGMLISPRMDLSAGADTTLELSFYTYFRYFQWQEWSVAISLDDGGTWSLPFAIESYLPTSQHRTPQGLVHLLLPDSLTRGGLSLTQCRLRFVFEGDYYFAMVDDISIGIAPAQEVRIAPIDPDGADPITRGNIVRMGTEAAVAYKHLDLAQTPSPWRWGARLMNQGHKDITASDGVRLVCKVEALGWSMPMTIYEDTLYLSQQDTLKARDLGGIVVSKRLPDLSFLSMPTGTSTYTCAVTYWVEQPNGGRTEGDTVRHSFNLNDILQYSHPYQRHVLSKGWQYAHYIVNIGPQSEVFHFPVTGAYQSVEYGALYYLGGSYNNAPGTYGIDELYLDSVVWSCQRPMIYTGDSMVTVHLKVYTYQDGQGGMADGQIQAGELTPILTRSQVVDVYRNDPVLFNGQRVVFPPTAGQPMDQLTLDRFYLITVQQTSANGRPLQAQHALQFGASRSFNYVLNQMESTTDAPFSATVLGLQDTTANGTVTWSTPVGLSELAADMLVYTFVLPHYPATTQVPNLNTALKLYPNPAQEYCTAQLEGDYSAATLVTCVVTDAQGRVWKHQTQPFGQQPYLLSVADLPAGIYHLTLIAPDQQYTQSFTKH